MNGRIWVESLPSQGSTFHFTASFAVATKNVAAQQEPALESIADLPVLVVDDNATNRRIVHEMLAHWGFQPVTVDSGRAALEALERAHAQGRPFPLALLDGRMPEMDGFELAARVRENPAFASTRIVLLTSTTRSGDAARCQDLGIAASLIKPIRQSDLRAALMKTLGHEPQQSVNAAASPASNEAQVLAVLVAEDNVVNQRLASKLLEKRGHRVTVVGNGREAVSATASQAFDVVLMDVQMPEMNGFEATQAIRLREDGTGRHVPIVAMTAHAMKGDRERCLLAGMDGYVSKPIEPADLLGTIARVTAAIQSVRVVDAAVEGDAAATLDRDAALARADGDMTLLRELVILFTEVQPSLLADIRQALDAADCDALQRAAHALKGSVGNFGAHRAFAAAVSLEMIARDRRLQDAPAACNALEQELDRLSDALAQWTASAAA